MRNYVEDPENPGKKIDAIELLKRNPDVPPPPEAVLDLMRRDNWTRHEALLILAGFSPNNNVINGTPLGQPEAGVVYLDGTTNGMISYAGLTQPHPIQHRMFLDYAQLRWYASGGDVDERRTPVEWLAWAESKGFEPYWLQYWNEWINKQRGPVSCGCVESTSDVIRHVERRERGRYTLREAAEAFAENTGEQSPVMGDKLMAAVKSGALKVYAPRSEVSYQSETVRDFYEEAYWNDLNAWLASAEPRISWRFPEPQRWDTFEMRPDTIEQLVASIKTKKDVQTFPLGWAYFLAHELAERNGLDHAAEEEAKAQILCTFEADVDTLPLRQSPSNLPLPKEQPLPPQWWLRCQMSKADLRIWAREYAPDFLGSALLAEHDEAPTANQGRPERETKRAQIPDGMRVWCLWSQAAYALASRQAIEDEAQAKRVLRRLGYYEIGDRRFPFPAPERSAESLAKFPDLKDVPRDGNAQSKLLRHRETEHKRALEQLHADGKIKFYNPATLCRIRYGEASDPIVYMDEIAELIKSHHAERADASRQEVESERADAKQAATPGKITWQDSARAIALDLLRNDPRLAKLSNEQIGGKVRKVMVERHERGEQGMTNRSGDVPEATSIKRWALTGIKNSG